MGAALTSAIGPRPLLDPNKLSASIADKVSPGVVDKARSTSQDFESVFLNSMFSQMFTNIGAEGPFGGGPATGVWRSFLTNEYAKSFAKAGGIGIGDEVYRALIAHQQGPK